MSFEESIGRNRSRIRGYVVSFTQSAGSHYSTGFKLFNSIFRNEPFQLSRAGHNRYGETSSYSVLRISDPFSLDVREVVCPSDLRDFHPQVNDEVELTATVLPHSNTYYADKILNLTTQRCYNSRIWVVSPHVIRALIIALLAAIAVSIFSLTRFIASGGLTSVLSAIISALMPLAIMLVGIFFILRSAFPGLGRRREYRDDNYRRRGRW